jgi:hypothetical protein
LFASNKFSVKRLVMQLLAGKDLWIPNLYGFLLTVN